MLVLYRLTQSDPAPLSTVTSPKVIDVLTGPWFDDQTSKCIAARDSSTAQKQLVKHKIHKSAILSLSSPHPGEALIWSREAANNLPL